MGDWRWYERAKSETLWPLIKSLSACCHIPIASRFSIAADRNTCKDLSMPTNVMTLTALQIAAAIEQRTLTCEGVARAYLERIASREPVVHAWSVVDAERTLEYARELDRAPRRGSLQGLPVAVKDIIDTADFPTEYGSPIYKNHRPVADDACVAILRAAGASIPGKAVTT